jgi:RND superfamily putative drug exporter
VITGYRIYSQVVGPVSANATQLIVLIGLAVAVDYSLFMITRFRVERRAGRDRAKAIEVSSSTAGRAVFFSGLAVMISLAGLITLGISLFTSMAVGTISVVLVSVIGSLTFLPATLAILGDRVNMGRPAAGCRGARRPAGAGRRWPSALAGSTIGRRPEGSGLGRLVTWVMARPVP